LLYATKRFEFLDTWIAGVSCERIPL
jgi:hypothetical protein